MNECLFMKAWVFWLFARVLPGYCKLYYEYVVMAFWVVLGLLSMVFWLNARGFLRNLVLMFLSVGSMVFWPYAGLFLVVASVLLGIHAELG